MASNSSENALATSADSIRNRTSSLIVAAASSRETHDKRTQLVEPFKAQPSRSASGTLRLAAQARRVEMSRQRREEPDCTEVSVTGV